MTCGARITPATTHPQKLFNLSNVLSSSRPSLTTTPNRKHLWRQNDTQPVPEGLSLHLSHTHTHAHTTYSHASSTEDTAPLRPPSHHLDRVLTRAPPAAPLDDSRVPLPQLFV